MARILRQARGKAEDVQKISAAGGKPHRSRFGRVRAERLDRARFAKVYRVAHGARARRKHRRRHTVGGRVVAQKSGGARARRRRAYRRGSPTENATKKGGGVFAARAAQDRALHMRARRRKAVRRAVLPVHGTAHRRATRARMDGPRPRARRAHRFQNVRRQLGERSVRQDNANAQDRNVDAHHTGC